MAFTEGFWAANTIGSVDNMNACLLGWGPKADFPAAAAGNKGRVAWATDEALLYYSNGSAWVNFGFITAYTEIASPPSQTTIATWADFDLSATIPSGAKAVVLIADKNSTTAYAPGARKNGSASTFTAPTPPNRVSITFIIELDSLRIVEIYDGGGQVTTFYAVGYFR